MAKKKTKTRKQTSDALSSLASRILSGEPYDYTHAEVKKIAASVLSQDETRGKRK